MKSLLHQTFQSSNTISSLRLFSSLSLLKIPPNPCIQFDKNSASFNQFHPFHTQSQNISIIETKANPARLAKTPLPLSDVFATNCLADSYRKSGLVNEALHLLGKIPHPNLISWNLMISCYNQSSRYEGSLRTFCSMRSLGFEPNQFTFGSVLSACAVSQNLQFGEQVYSLVLKNGLFSNAYVFTGLIDLFSKSGCFDDALRVFSEMSVVENVVCWNAIIAGGVRNGENMIALDLFCQMVEGFCMPNGFTFSSVLSACAAAGELEMGSKIHAWVVKCDAKDDIFVGTTIVDLYAKCGDMDAAVKAFSRMPVRNVVSWTAVISGFAQKEEAFSALQFFKEMIRNSLDINKYTVTSVLFACAKPLMAKEAIQIHCWILKTGFSMDIVVKDALISTYAKIGDTQMSEKVFKETGIVESPGTWSAVISGLAQNQSLRKSIDLFQMMFRKGLKPDMFCTSSVLSIVDCVYLGRQIHSYVVKAGLVDALLVGSALFTMYSKCGCIEDSYEIFGQMQERDGVAWTSMIAGFAGRGYADKGFRLFREMMVKEIKPDKMTLSALLTACHAQQFLVKGKEIHGYALRVGLGLDTLISGTLVTMYSQCKSLVSSRRVFAGIQQKDQIMWSSLISGYAQNGFSEEALSEFHRMVITGFEIDQFTSSSVLSVCATLSRSGLGKELHAHVFKAGLSFHPSVSSALLAMYSKCGSIDDSHKVFDEIENPDLVTWTAMIDGYAQHGSGVEALKIFERMKEEGTRPDSLTLVSVLSACSHNGLVEEGFQHFNSLRRDYGIEPNIHHYACMVDLLTRAGMLREAANFIYRMPIEPDALVWSTLLGACKVHGDVELGRIAAKRVLELEPHDSGAYISLSNISAEMGDWEEVLRIRSSMKGVGMKKDPGWSVV